MAEWRRRRARGGGRGGRRRTTWRSRALLRERHKLAWDGCGGRRRKLAETPQLRDRVGKRRKSAVGAWHPSKPRRDVGRSGAAGGSRVVRGETPRPRSPAVGVRQLGAADAALPTHPHPNLPEPLRGASLAAGPRATDRDSVRARVAVQRGWSGSEERADILQSNLPAHAVPSRRRRPRQLHRRRRRRLARVRGLLDADRRPHLSRPPSASTCPRRGAIALAARRRLLPRPRQAGGARRGAAPRRARTGAPRVQPLLGTAHHVLFVERRRARGAADPQVGPGRPLRQLGGVPRRALLCRQPLVVERRHVFRLW